MLTHTTETRRPPSHTRLCAQGRAALDPELGPRGMGLPPAGGPDHLAQGLASRDQADLESRLPRRELCNFGLGRVILPSG